MQMDSGIMMSVQIAIVGIVVVVGLFVLWRRIARLEERIDAVSNMQRLIGSGMGIGSGSNGGDAHPSCIGMPDEDIMAAIFDLPLGRGHAGIIEGDSDQPNVTITEDDEEEIVGGGDSDSEHVEVAKQLADTAESDSSVVMSKNKLRKLTMDELKTMLEGRGMSTDGNKAILIDRIQGGDM